ncbi:MAG: AMP-binding protein [Deltaproteobacteria bacterium]|jgi:acyl-CoA synthetase (AMP-forming)/AMP-acid ligase II|nr:AMP-binding protein [Deltaproteobacteria bacterium]MBT4639638.1 AMP-binding protein [Deltaproteobacteria bacterium]MBT7151497.1 AMP-binding protein [Deltaproteobacteria bacterium]MBT7712958.1 AMP-binding protein [Deltaproteobacteria bacterium]
MASITKCGLIGDALIEAVRTHADSVGFVYQGKEVSFQEMDVTSDRVAWGLLNLGFKPGDRLGIIGLNQLEWLYTYFAAVKIGLVIVGLNVRYRDQELDYMLNQSDALGIVTLTNFADMDYVSFFDGFRDKIPSVRNYIFIGGEGFPGSTSFDSLLNTEVDQAALNKIKAAVGPEDLDMIIYTSGTTGKPKGAGLSHASHLASASAQAEHCQISDKDTMLAVLPFNHVGGITCTVLASLLGKVKIVLIPFVDLEMIIEQAKIHKPTFFGGVPTLFTLLFMSENFTSWDTSAIRIVAAGGSNVEPGLLSQIKEAYPNATLMNLYGLSESSGAVVMSPWDSPAEKTIKTIGKPLGTFQAKIVDKDNKEMHVGETGELCFKAAAVCQGYFRMPEETREAFDDDGWLHTGDMGFIDDEGYITLMGRKKEMYLQGGFNVYPVEVENLLTKHPKVQMAAGIGVSDPVLGEVGRYYIVAVPGAELSDEEIKSYCAEHLADYKVPRQVVFKDTLPLTPVGKIMKSKIKEDFINTGE